MSGLRKQTPVALPTSTNDDQTRRSALRNSPVRGREARRPSSTAKVRRSWGSTTRPLCPDSKANAFPWFFTQLPDRYWTRGVGVGVSVVEVHQQLRIIGDGRHGSRLL